MSPWSDFRLANQVPLCPFPAVITYTTSQIPPQLPFPFSTPSEAEKPMSGLWSFRGGVSATPAGAPAESAPPCMAVMMLSAFDPSYGVGSEAPSVATATGLPPRSGKSSSKLDPSVASYTNIADTESEEEEGDFLESHDGLEDAEDGKWWSHMIERDDGSVGSASSNHSHNSSRASSPEVLGPHPDDGVEAILSRLRKVPVATSAPRHQLTTAFTRDPDREVDPDDLRAARDILVSSHSTEPRDAELGGASGKRKTTKSRDPLQAVEKSNIRVIKRVEEKKKALSSFAVSSGRAGSRSSGLDGRDSTDATGSTSLQMSSKEKPDWSEVQKIRRLERDRARAEAKAERELDERIQAERKRLQSELQRLRSTEIQFEATRNAIEKGKKGSIPGVPHCPPQPTGSGLVLSRGTHLVNSGPQGAVHPVFPTPSPQPPLAPTIPRNEPMVNSGAPFAQQSSFESPDKHFIATDHQGDSPPSPPGTSAHPVPILTPSAGSTSTAKESKKSTKVSSQPIHRDAVAVSTSVEAGNQGDGCSLSSEGLPAHQAMAARREERERARLLLKQKYEASREQRYAQAMAEVEAEERRLLDEKKKAALHRKKLKEEAAAAEERKRLEELRKAESKQKATSFNRRRLLKWFGVLPWKSFVALRRSQSEALSRIADDGRKQLSFRRWQLFLRQQQSFRQIQSVLREIQMVNVVKRCWLRNLFHRWKVFQEYSVYEARVLSVEQYKRFLLRRWKGKALRSVDRREAQQMQLAERHERFRMVRRAFSGWQQVVRSEKMQRQRDEVRSKLWNRAQAVLQDVPRSGGL
jgi:hypothetical protein